MRAPRSRGSVAGWSSLAARRAHNPKVVGSNPTPATTFTFTAPCDSRDALVVRFRQLWRRSHIKFRPRTTESVRSRCQRYRSGNPISRLETHPIDETVPITGRCTGLRHLSKASTCRRSSDSLRHCTTGMALVVTFSFLQYTVFPTLWNFRYDRAACWNFFSNSVAAAGVVAGTAADAAVEARCEAQPAIKRRPTASRTERKTCLLAMRFTPFDARLKRGERPIYSMIQLPCKRNPLCWPSCR